MSGLMLFTGHTIAQTYEHFEFDTTTWVFPEKYQILEFEGKQSLLLEKTSDDVDGSWNAYLKEYDFSDGIIEFDLFCPQKYESYVGFFFRLNWYKEEPRYELFYFRPFLTNEIGSVQYMPVNNGIVNWPDYVDFVYKSKGDIPWNEWIHVKAEIEGPCAIVSINDKEVMTVHNLGRGLSKGSVGLWLGNTQRCYYANFKVAKQEGT